MKAYRLRHKPTGLFFKASKYRSKANLSEEGRLYLHRVSVNILGNQYHHPASEDNGYETRKVRPEEWEVVEYFLTEIDPETGSRLC